MAYSPQTGYFYAIGARGVDAGCGAPRIRTSSARVHARVPGLNSLATGSWRPSTARPARSPGRRNSARGRPSGRDGHRRRPDVPDIARRQPRTPTTPRPATWCGSSRPDPANGGPAASYEIDGEQYIATVAGKQRLGVQARWHAASRAATARGTAAGRTLRRADHGHRDRSRPLRCIRTRGFTGTRYFTDDYAFEPLSRAGEGRHARSPGATTAGWSTRSWRRTARGRPARCIRRSGRRQGVRQARDLYLHLQGTSLGLCADHRQHGHQDQRGLHRRRPRDAARNRSGRDAEGRNADSASASRKIGRRDRGDLQGCPRPEDYARTRTDRRVRDASRGGPVWPPKRAGIWAGPDDHVENVAITSVGSAAAPASSPRPSRSRSGSRCRR